MSTNSEVVVVDRDLVVDPVVVDPVVVDPVVVDPVVVDPVVVDPVVDPVVVDPVVVDPVVVDPVVVDPVVDPVVECLNSSGKRTREEEDGIHDGDEEEAPVNEKRSRPLQRNHNCPVCEKIV